LIDPSSRPVEVVYIGGAGRSGSTLLDRLLEQQDGVVSVGEFVDIWDRGVLRDERCGCGERFRSCAFWNDVGMRAMNGWSNLDIGRTIALQNSVVRQRCIPLLLRPQLSQRFARGLAEYAELLAKVYRAIADVSGASLVVDSSKVCAGALVVSHARGVRLRVVHLVRDGRGVAYSHQRKVTRPQSPDQMERLGAAHAGARWMATNLEYHLLERAGVPVHRVRYEDLIHDVPSYVGRILGRDISLGGDWRGSSYLRPGHGVAGNPIRLKHGATALSLDDEWRREMGRADHMVVTALGAPLLRHYGYLTGDDQRPSLAASKGSA
jgi:hypothetical protein